MIRKHIKVEPALWYSHCDRAGIIVWQDMPSDDSTLLWQPHNYFNSVELNRRATSEDNYRKQYYPSRLLNPASGLMTYD